MKADYHVHTNFSDDSNYPMEEVVKDALKNNLDEICFTDHVDYGVKFDHDDKNRPKDAVMNVNYPLYYRAYQNVKELYGDKISIKFGIEFGVQKDTIKKYESLFKKYPFDFIILSIHQVDNKELHSWNFQRGKTQEEYNRRYYEELLYLVENYHDYSVLGHMDLITRYDDKGAYPFEELRPIITDILKIVIKDNKGIEVNTSSHRYGLNDLTPSKDILRLYKKLGGTIITIGSDSHKKEHLGAYIDETKEELKTLGFDKFCTFDRMKPTFHKL